MHVFARDLVAILIEIFIILGFVAGIACFTWLAALRLARGPWIAVTGVVADGILYWYAHDGPVRQRALSPEELDLHPDDTHVEVHYRTRRGYSTSFERINPDEHLLKRLGVLFGGLGIVSTVVSFVLIFVPHPGSPE